MTDTPRTDALGLDIPQPNGWIYNPAYILDFARQLEREIAETKNLLDHEMLAKEVARQANTQLERELAKVTEERDEACAELKAARSWILRDLIMRGALVDALRKIAESTTSGSLWTDCECMRAIARLAIDNHNKGVTHE